MIRSFRFYGNYVLFMEKLHFMLLWFTFIFAARLILTVTNTKIQNIMETTNKEVVEHKTYVHDENKKNYATKGEALGIGIPALTLGGLAFLKQMNDGRGIFGFGGSNMPENVNINTATGGAGSGSAPTAFQAWEKSCDDAIELTNAMWGLKVSSMQADYDHRNTDIAEKFSIWKSQTDGDFALYKSVRDLYDNTNDKMNAANFGLYKNQRDGFDTIMARVSELEKQVAIGAAIRPYQDKLIQCEIDKAYTAGINYTDRKTCRAIYGVVGLPSTPTVTVLEGANPYGCNCRSTAASGGTTA